LNVKCFLHSDFVVAFGHGFCFDLLFLLIDLGYGTGY